MEHLLDFLKGTVEVVLCDGFDWDRRNSAVVERHLSRGEVEEFFKQQVFAKQDFRIPNQTDENEHYVAVGYLEDGRCVGVSLTLQIRRRGVFIYVHSARPLTGKEQKTYEEIETKILESGF